MQNEVICNIKRYILGGWSRFSIVQYNSENNIIKEDYEVKYSNKNRNMYFVYARDLYKNKLYYHGYITDYSSGLSYKKAKTLKMRSMSDYNEKAISALMWVLERSDNLPKRVKIFNDGTCAKCGRPLLNEDVEGCGFCCECKRKFNK